MLPVPFRDTHKISSRRLLLHTPLKAPSEDFAVQKTEFNMIFLDFSMSFGRMEGMSAEETSLKEVHVRNLDRQQVDKLALTNPVLIGNMANIYRGCPNLRAD